MQTLKIKQLDPDAVIPSYGTEDAACFDLTVIPKVNIYFTVSYIDAEKRMAYGTTNMVGFHTGLAMQAPKSYQLLIFNRSSTAKFGFGLSNAVGIVDHDYTGEVFVNVQQGFPIANAPFASVNVFCDDYKGENVLDGFLINQVHKNPEDFFDVENVLTKIQQLKNDNPLRDYWNNAVTVTVTLDLRDPLFKDFKVSPKRLFQAQILPVYPVKFEVVPELEQTVRGTGGFGSTGH